MFCPRFCRVVVVACLYLFFVTYFLIQTFFVLWFLFTDQYFFSFLLCIFRLPVVSDCPAGQTARVTSNLHSSSSSTMAVTRVPSPPLSEVNTPVAENWCYTQVSLLYFCYFEWSCMWTLWTYWIRPVYWSHSNYSSNI